MQPLTYTGLQRTFSKDYSNILKQAVKQGNIAPYMEDSFKVNDTNNHIYRLQQLMHTDVVLSTDKSEFENAQTFYEAYKNLSPLIASEEAFWAYMTHVEHYEYVRKRWKIDTNTSVESIIDHFFVASTIKIARNGVARLWWPMYLTYDESNQTDPYHLARILYSHTDTLQMLSESKLFSCRNLIRSILRFFEENTDIPETQWLQINRYIIRYYNSVGGVRKLIYLTEDYFDTELQRNKELLKGLPPRETGVKIPLNWNM